MSAESIRQMAMIGLGTMGHGIALSHAVAGCTVRGYDALGSMRDSTLERIGANLDQLAGAGVIDAEAIEPALQRITICDSEGSAVDGADLVVEAISEDLDLKQQLLSRIEAAVRPDTILASNTSTFTMSQMGVGLRRPGRALNTHWFNPPHIVPVVEVVPAPRTEEGTTQTVLALLRRLGKVAVRLRQEIPGFIVNRVQIAMAREVIDLWSRGVASAEDIDAAIRGSMGFRLAALGPMRIADCGGLDIWSKVYGELVREIRSDQEVPERISDLVGQGHYGVKTGKGIFDYTPESIEQLLKERDHRFLALARLLWADRASGD